MHLTDAVVVPLKGKEQKVKTINQILVCAALSGGLVGVAQAHVFVGVGVGIPVAPMYVPPPVYVAPPVYAAPPVYYAPPPPRVVYAPAVAVGWYGRPAYYPGYYRHWHHGYGYRY
jgi:hypothetical protein